ncbi:unnamed protein product [Dicrocoelium dendriticum]|nr:unnamed protein product [Dicrocoelium dendriticum]
MPWGSITVQAVDNNGKIKPNEQVKYRDAKLWPGGSRGWDWRETGTSHIPGVQTSDVEELIASNPDIIILSRGVLRVLQVPDSTRTYIREKLPKVELIVEPSKSAYHIYNTKAKEGKRVAALLHTTC